MCWSMLFYQRHFRTSLICSRIFNFLRIHFFPYFCEADHQETAEVAVCDCRSITRGAEVHSHVYFKVFCIMLQSDDFCL